MGIATLGRLLYRGGLRAYRVAVLYWFVRRLTYWLAGDVYYRVVEPLYPLAMDWSERSSVLTFVAKWTLLTQRLVPRRFLRRLLADTEIRVQGVTSVVSLESGEVFTLKEIYGDHVYDRVPDFVPTAGWTVFDIGANVGMFAIKQARRGADVYAFEPNPDCYRRLMKVVDANGQGDRIHTINYALGETAGAGTLIVPDGLTPSGSIDPIDQTSLGFSGPTLQITSLDLITPALAARHIDLLKIDAEGAEVAILRGATETLTLVKRVVIEYHTRELLSKVREILRERGFVEMLQLDTHPEIGVGVLYARSTME